METALGNNKNWKAVKTLDEAKQLIDYGVIIKWAEMKALKRSFTEEEQSSIVRHFAKRLCERADDRLASEILVESLLIWIANSISEPLVAGFFEQLFAEPGHDIACRSLVEIALTSEVSENSHDEELYAVAVSLVCELGIAIYRLGRSSPGEFRNAAPVLDHITTYLLSVSNNNSSCIRLSLLHYFGYTSSDLDDKASFNRVMSRFGHTVLDHLFNLLFNKKSEAIALQFLLGNLPFVLAADGHCQRILHETFKYYMLKKPERFALFLQTFSDYLLSDADGVAARHVYLQHLGALFKVVSEVNHKPLAREILITVQKFHGDSFCLELINQILEEPTIRSSFKDLLKQLKGSSNSAQFAESVAQFKAPKRGRKPTFARADQIGTLGQVAFLGGLEISRAS